MPNVPNSRAWQLQALIAAARPASPFSSDTGQVFASIPLNTEAQQVVPLSSRAFYNWLLSSFYGQHELTPRPSALREIIQLLEAQAQFGHSTSPVRPTIARRVASAPGKVLLDLYNAPGEAVEITAAGWRITQNLDGCFRSARSARPLPRPETPPHGPAAAFDSLRKLLGLSPEHFAPCLSWLIAALQPAGPYPILVLQGPASSAKSAIAQRLRALLDPGPGPFCPPPTGSRDLQSLASHNWIIALDRIDSLSAPLVHQLARIATGTTFAARDRASDPEPFHLHLSRPILLTTDRAFTDRAITIHLPPHSAPASDAEFEQLRPQVLGALCQIVSASLAGKRSPYPTAEYWITSADPFAAAVGKFMGSQTNWTGTATELLLRLRAIDPRLAWPATPKGLTQLLNRTGLNNIDFQSLRDPHGTRSVSLRKIELTPKLCADAPQPPARTAPPKRATAVRPSIHRAPERRASLSLQARVGSIMALPGGSPMPSRIVLLCSAGLAITASLLAQTGTPTGARGTPTTGTPTVPTTPTNPNSRSPTSFPNPNQQTIDTMQRPLYVSGKVVLDDGTPPPESLVMQIVCNGSPRSIGYTDSKGRFSIDLGNRNNSAVFADASQPGSFGGAGGFGGANTTGQIPGANAGGLSERNLMGCDLQASLAGFRSDAINLGTRHSLDNPEVGTIVLHRTANVEGLTISATSALAPKDAKKAFEKGWNEIKKSKWENAEKELAKAVDIYPKYAAAWYQLGYVQQSQNNLEAARKSYAQSLQADPKFVSPYLQLAVLAARENNWKEVAADTDRLLRLNPVDFPQAWLYNSLANYHLQNWDASEKSARQGLEVDKGHHLPKLDHLLGVLLAQKRDYAGAAEHMRNYLALNPTGPDAELVKKQLAEVQKVTAAQAGAKAPAPEEPPKQ